MAAVKVPLLEASFPGIAGGWLRAISFHAMALIRSIASRRSLHRAYLWPKRKTGFQFRSVRTFALFPPSSSQGLDTEINAAWKKSAEDVDIADKLHRSIQACLVVSGNNAFGHASMWPQIWPTLNPYAKLLILDEPAAPLILPIKPYLQAH
ncbi:hypothetical protein OH492_26925 [Vibrio chagasii]|nr:hypothetical protein [Vibrio chagasii]